MSDFMQTGTAWLQGQRRATMTHSVVYSRPSTGQSCTVPATKAKTQEQLIDAMGMLLQAEENDYLVTCNDIVLGGLRFDGQADNAQPILGDQIIDVLNGIAKVYQVQNTAASKCWHWADEQNHLTMRVHTKDMGTTGTQ